MSADATLAGMPLSVPWSVQYSFLGGHSGIEIFDHVLFTVVMYCAYISLNST